MKQEKTSAAVASKAGKLLNVRKRMVKIQDRCLNSFEVVEKSMQMLDAEVGALVDTVSNSFFELDELLDEIEAVAASALTQAPNKKKK